MRRTHRPARLINWHQIASAILTVCLLSSSTLAAPQTVAAIANDSALSFLLWFNNSGLRKLVQGQRVTAKKQEKQSDRDAKISQIQIFPGNLTVDLNEHVKFNAIAFDANGNSVGGVNIKWNAQGSATDHHAPISHHGDFESGRAGTFTVTAETNGRTAQVAVVVRPGLKRDLSLPPTNIRQVSSRDVPAVMIGSNQPKPSNGKARADSSQQANKTLVASKRSHASLVSTNTPEPLPQGGEAGWDGTNYWSADEPNNRVGDPQGTSADGGAGSGNFQFAAPVISLPGRGINISLGLAYNSRVWNKAGSQMSYDNDRGWPSPGFSLGFGKLLGMGVYNGGMLVDADGTRHGYTGSISVYNWGTRFVGHTTDGSFIDYSYWSGTGGGITSATAQLPNGTFINYGAAGPGAVYPTSVEDADGNYIVISYVNNVGPRIQNITDTLGRTINFYYDYNNLPTAITASGLDGASRTLARLHYHQVGLDYGFNNLNAVVRDPAPWMIDAIYYPSTSTGYWLNDPDSYSTYGMLAKVVEQRGMGFSASSLTDMGSVSPGAITCRETYNYPLSPDYSLIDAPTYTSMTENWSRDGTILDSATTLYEVHENDSPRTTIITLPNGTKSKQLAVNAQGQWNDGLVYHDETYVTEGQPLQTSTSFWEQGDYNSPRPTRVEKTDERGQITAAEFSYGAAYNQVTELRDYDYGGTSLLRATRATYQNSDSYTGHQTSYTYVGRHIFNLPLSVEVYASDYSTRVSHADYQYDGQTLADTPNVVMHDDTCNPYAPPYEICDCNQWDYWQIDCLQWNCYWRSDYNSQTNARGNVTQVTTYADGLSLTGAVTETRSYDITGNVVTASTSCCEQNSFNYTINTQYAYPESKTHGSASDPYAQVTTSATYDFYTGLGKTATDASNRIAQVSYDPNTLRVSSSLSPTNAHADFSYDDNAMTVTQTSYLDNGGVAGQNVKSLNGRGQVRQERALGVGGVWDYVDTTYDAMGQALQQTRPYRRGDSQQLSTMAYDALGRVKTITAPDGSVTRSFFNEATRPDVASSSPGETTRVQDAWGRERWGRTDSTGRLVEIVEPNPNGDGLVATGGLVTTYAYNTLGNLVTINSLTDGQVEQGRSFTYDSLGRLTAQKLTEVNATLDSAGAYHSTGGTWSDIFTYDERSNLTSRTDARGVKTVYSYNNDPLNRLQSVSWDTSGFGDTANPILPAATITYQYRTKANPTDLKDVTQLASITTNGVSTESYGFDDEGRVSSKTITLSSRPSFPFATDYVYDSLDRITDVWYPAEYGNGAQARKRVHHDYDIASRISALSFDGQTFASNIVYNAASQTTSLAVGTGPNAVNETYNYNPLTGLLDSQTLVRNGATLLSLSYDYTNASGKRTGQLTKIYNNLDHGKDRSYSYDVLGRLVQATGGPSGSFWTETYSYDRYGNRTGVSASGHTARLEKPAEPKPNLPTDLIAKNTAVELPAWLRQKEGSPVSDSTTPLFRPSTTSSTTNSKSATTLNPQSGSTKIAFASNRDGTDQIYTMNPDGSGQTRITNNQTDDDAPRWSANNSRIVFQSDRDNPFCDLFDIYSMNADGRGQTRLTTEANDDRAPVWSPDGTKIAFQSFRNGSTYQIYVMNADGSGQTNLSNSGANDVQPAWSPDGSKIAFASDREHAGVFSIYTMNTNGSGQTNISNNSYDEEQPSWSPDSSRIAFMSERDSTTDYWNETDDNGNPISRSRVNINKEVYLMYANGSGQTRLSNRLENDESPSWSNDGSKLVFRSDRERDNSDPIPQIWSMNIDGSGQTNLSNNQSGDYMPSSQFALGGGSPPSVPADGNTSQTYDNSSNRITTAGFAYDVDGNEVRTLIAGGGGYQRFRYDAANRMVQVLADNNSTVLATYIYGSSNERLISDEGGYRTYFDCEDGATIAEYSEADNSATPVWSKSYVYLGARLLSTLTPNGSGEDAIQFHHPDRLGTRLVTDPSNGTSFEQVNLPFGTALNAESTGATNRRFTSYDRSSTTGLDYAVNRHYDFQQGRFTQVDPVGMGSVSLTNPQTLNLYAYCGSDPINHVDPNGLGFLSFLKSVFKRVVHALLHAVVQAVLTFLMTGSVHAAIGVFISDFLTQLGWPSKGWSPLTPQWNPNSKPIIGNGVGSLSRYVIVNFQDPGLQLPDCSTGAVPCDAGGLIWTKTSAPKPWYARIWGGIKRGARTIVGGIQVAIGLGMVYNQRYDAWYQRTVQSRVDALDRRMAENSVVRDSRGRPIFIIAIPSAGVVEDVGELRFLHPTLSESSLEYLREQSTEDLIRSLSPGAESPLIVKPNGVIMQGNHRIQVLMERGVDVTKLPRVPYP